MTRSSEVGACLQAMVRPNPDNAQSRLHAGSHPLDPRPLPSPPPEARA